MNIRLIFLCISYFLWVYNLIFMVDEPEDLFFYLPLVLFSVFGLLIF